MKTIAFMISALLMISCDIHSGKKVEQNPSVEKQSETPNQKPQAVSFDVAEPKSLIGKKLEDVEEALKAAQIPYRVVRKDGQVFPVTMDYISHRLNFQIENGAIVGVTNG